MPHRKRRRRLVREGRPLPEPSRAQTVISLLTDQSGCPGASYRIHLIRDGGLEELGSSIWLALVLACVAGLSLGRYHLTWQRFSFRGLPKHWQYLALAGFAGWLVTITLYFDIVRQLHLGVLVPHSNVSPALFSDSLPLAIYTFLRSSLFSPFVADVFFHGFVFQGILGRRLLWKLPRSTLDMTIGPWTAALISAALYAGLSSQVGLLIPLTITGVIFAWIYLSSGSLWTVIICHAACDSFALIRAIGLFGS